jgi:hypothetical protein
MSRSQRPLCVNVKDPTFAPLLRRFAARGENGAPAYAKASAGRPARGGGQAWGTRRAMGRPFGERCHFIGKIYIIRLRLLLLTSFGKRLLSQEVRLP